MLNTTTEATENSAGCAGKASKRKRAKRKRGQQWAFYVESFKRTVDCLYEICRSDHNINGCKEAIIYLENAKRDFESLINTINVEASWDESSKKQAVAWEIRKTTRSPVQVSLDAMPSSGLLMNEAPLCEEDEDFKEAARLSLDDGWQVVLPRRKRSTSSSGDIAPFHDDVMSETAPPEQREVEPPRPNVYDRLSAPRRTVSPSVSNMATPSSRHNSIRSSVGLQSGRLTCPKSAMDLPQTKASMAKMAYSRQLLWERNQSLLAEKLRTKQRMERVERRRRAGPSRCGIHFADRSQTQTSGNSFRQRIQCDSAPASERNPSVDRSLQSINEVGEVDETETVPADPTPTDSKRDTIRFSTTRSEPAFGEVSSLLGLDDDVEWKEMTEEEESLALEEQSLNLEIEHEESFSIDIELERQVAAEAEALEKFELSQKAALSANQGKQTENNASSCDVGQQADLIGDEYRRRPILTWSEVVGKEVMPPYREPGTVAERHEKMSSPSRRRCDKNDVDFSIRHAEKLKRATELRAQLQAEKTARLRELTRRVEEVREKRQKVIERKRQLLESRMERAQENREKNITEIIRKAKDDEQKVLEVQFINSLQGGNMILDLRMRDAGVEERKQTMAEERARRMEEKAAKEHAAEERRKVAEMERIARLQEIAERKEARHAQLAAQRSEQERLRSEKRKLQQEKLTELRLADAEENESLRKRIQEKIESTSRRHEQNLEDVRIRAQEFSSPRPPSGCRWTWSFVDYNHWPSDTQGTVFKCASCSTDVSTELEAVAHVMSQTHLSKTSIDHHTVSTEDLEKEYCSLTQSPAPESTEITQEDESVWRKKRVKVKQRLAARNKKVSETVEKPPSPNSRQVKCIRDLTNAMSKFQHRQGRLEDSTIQSLERALVDVCRESESQEWLVTNLARPFAYSSLLSDLLFIQMKWASKGGTPRLFLKISATICRLCSVPSLCRSVLFTPVLVELMDSIMLQLKRHEYDSELLCSLDVLLATVKCARNTDEWESCGVDGHEMEIRISMIASYLLASRFPQILEDVINPSISLPILIRLNSLHLEFAGVSSEDTSTITWAFCDLLLKATISSLRSAPLDTSETDSDSVNAEEFVGMAISCSLGGQRSLLSVIAALPVYYLTRASLRVFFITALITTTYECRRATQLLMEELSVKHLLMFISEVKMGKVPHSEVLQRIAPNGAMDELARFYNTRSGASRMFDTAELYTAVARVFSCPVKASTTDLSKACRFCATDEQSVQAFEGVQDLKGALFGLLTVSLEGRGDNDSSTIDVRRARLALRTLINAVNRSKKLAESITPECVTLFRTLVRIPELHTETFAALAALARPMRIVCGLSDDYTVLLGELFLLWESRDVSDSDRSWISALVSIHLEEDFGFLASNFADLPSDEFIALLHITEVHANNISFCVDLLQRILYEFGEGVPSEKKMPYVEEIAYAVEIIASAALRGMEYSTQLLDRPVAVETVVDILESVLDAQWIDENEGCVEPSPQPHPDRPQKEPEVRCTRIQECPQLVALSAAVRDSPIEVRATLKCAAVRAIGNLCCERPSLRVAAGAKGAVLAVLRCARLTESDRPFIVQWSIAALRHLCMGCPENQKFILEMDQVGSDKTKRMDFSEIEKTIYGGNIEEDEELMAELLALQQEEEAKQRLKKCPSATQVYTSSDYQTKRWCSIRNYFLPGVDPTLLSKALADDVEVDESALENDPELLAELSGLIGSSEEEGSTAMEATSVKPPPSGVRDVALINRLRGLMAVYEKMLVASTKEGNSVKQKRHQRTVDRLKDLIVKAERGESIDESEIPPSPPSFAQPSEPTAPTSQPPAPPASQPPPVPRRSTSGAIPAYSTGAAPPPVPQRTSSSSLPTASPEKNADSRKEQILKVLKRRRDAYVANGKAAVAAMDKTAAKQYVEVAKMFDQALAALDTASADELDLAEVPPSPPPYRRPQAEKPATFFGGLQSRMERFQAIAKKAAEEGNDRKARMNKRMAEQYAAAIRDAKAGRPVAVADLPSLPDMPPLPPQKPLGAAPIGPAPGSRGEALSMMEKALIEQVQLAENSRMRFTRLGDVGKVKMFEDWAKASKQDLLLVREVAKQGLNLPKFHYESRHIPCADLFPDLAEDVLELSIIRCRDIPLPSGYEPSHANLFVKYTFPYPSDANQSGKTKYVSGTQNPGSFIFSGAFFMFR
ncbi:hypothetical protein GCK32_004320 [Trichostrongylus colubriformis]|uniref:Ataxin-10 n=1 Tax=Trichostrongylus colubriformis TaxID=6319 RepID=A0AAN8IG85_TRICO